MAQKRVPLVGILDPAALTGNAGWPLRNFALLLSEMCPEVPSWNILCLRGEVGAARVSAAEYVCKCNMSTDRAAALIGRKW